jgi:hypothetical protein
MSQQESLDGQQPSADADLPDLKSLLPPPPPPDPAVAASGALIRRACARLGLTLPDVGRDSTVALVILADPTWAGPVRDAWRRDVQGGEYPDDGDRGWLSSDPKWVTWTPEAQGRRIGARREEDCFAEALGAAKHCVGIATAPGLLPPDLVQAADVTLHLGRPTPEDIRDVATVLGAGDPAPMLTADEAAAVTPRILRLARRPGQDAGAYLLKLREVLGRETSAKASTPPVPAGSPREAPTLDRLFGMDEAVAWGRQLARDLGEFAAGRIPWSSVDRGVLLSGPPGTGKTLFARALASTCGVRLVSGSYASWLGTGGAHQGEMLRNMRNTFKEARDAGRAILFIDEVDAFPNRATVHHQYRDWEVQVVNALLAELDGVEAREGVVVVAACNLPDLLDPALTRSGRLDRHIRITLPDRDSLARILREHLRADLLGEDLSGVALAATGMTGADAERVVRGARRRAREDGRAMLVADLLDEVCGADAGADEEAHLRAVHEAGHAVAVSLLRPGHLRAVSLVPNGGSVEADKGHSLTPATVRLLLVEILAGRAAEQVVFGTPSSGAGGSPTSDLARATQLATIAGGALGFEEEAIGLAWRGPPDPAAAPRLLRDNPDLAVRVREALAAAHAEALEMMRRNRPALEAVADELMRRRFLDGPEAEGLVRRHRREAAR